MEIVEEISVRSQKFGAVPVLVGYVCEHDCTPKNGASYPFPIMRGTYYMPPVSKKQRVLHFYENRIKLIRRVADLIIITGELFISTQDACNLWNMPPASVNYIFTDPPYR